MAETLKGCISPLLLGAILLLFSGVSLARAGSIEYVTGDASIERNDVSLPALKDSRVESGDVLQTGPDGRMRVRMENGESIALHPNTRFIIDEFIPPDSADGPESGRSFYTFVRGGFDAVVMSLGRRDSSSYRVNTPVATMGIRGTAYTMVWTADGLYVQVTEGVVTLTNAAGTLSIAAGQIGFVGLGGLAPALVSSMPAIGAGAGAGTLLGAGPWVTGAAILGVLGGLAIIVNDDDGGSSSTPSTTP